MLRLALASIIFLTAPAFAADEPSFKFTLQKKDDSVEASWKEGRTYFTVTSPGGIGSATIKRDGKKWPEAVVLRLKLRGLEGFDATAGKLKMHAFVNVGSMKSITCEKDGKPIEGYDVKHPLWTEIRIDKENGVFEIALPKAFFDGNPETIDLHWIDYYRR